jgi:aminoglycoside phosphotransferase (APT) family kinase protein
MLLSAEDGPALARRLAEAAHKLHRAGVAPPRRHRLANELAILRDRLLKVAEKRPDWRARMKRLLASCERLANGTPSCVPCGIHRDFYPDQVLVAGDRLYLLDLDLYSAGDPALDIGNFRAHLIEQSLRQFGRPDALAEVEAALIERYLSLAGNVQLEAIEAYTTLSLARHIYISMQFADRCRHTETILDLCEERLPAARFARSSSA